MVEIPTIIPNPFNTIYDVTDQTPIDKIPKEYFHIQQQLKDEKTEAERLKTAIEEFSTVPDIEDLLIEQAHTTISKFDDHIIRVVFHVGLSTYFKPLNLGLKAASGTGKSYSTVETLNFLPEEDIEEIGSQSPKVISHQNGICKAKDGRVLDEKNLPKKPKLSDFNDPLEYADAKKQYEEAKTKFDEDIKDCYYEVDLRNKILVFLESVNLETFKMFKTTMSHDGEYIDHKFVDDRGKVHVTRLLGAPAMIFNSVDNNYIDEFATRTLSATPSDRIEKIEDSMRISNNKSAFPWIFEGTPFNQKVIKEYIRLIKKFMREGKIQVVIPFLGLDEAFGKTQVRDMRDFNKYLELLPSYAIFKLFQRPIVMIKGKRYLIPSIEDALNAKAAYDAILETTKTSTDYRVIDFYHSVVAKTSGITADALTDIYNKGRKRPITVSRVRQWLRRLEELEYVDIREAEDRNDKGYIDKRYNAYYPLKKNTDNVAILQTNVDLQAVLEKGFRKWLENASFQSDIPIIILNIDGTAKPITQEEMNNIIIKKGEKDNNNTFSLPITVLKEENKPESTSISQIHVKDAFSKTLFFERLTRKPGVLCSAIDNGGLGCTFEADFDLNGNRYCEGHFKNHVKMNSENGFEVKEKPSKGDFGQ